MKKLIVFIFIIVFGFVGWNMKKMNVSQSVEDIVSHMQQKMMEVESLHITGNISFNGTYNTYLIPTVDIAPKERTQDMKIKEGTIMFDMSGGLSDIAKDSYKGYIDVAMGYEIEGISGDVLFSLRSIDTLSYAQINKMNIPMQDDKAQMRDILSRIVKDKWILLTDKESIDDNTLYVSDTIEKLMTQLNLFKDLNIIGTEKIRDKNTVHIQVSFNRDDMQAIILELSKGTNIRGKINSDDILDIIEKMSVDLWIGSFDSLLYKVQLSGPFIDENQGIDGNLDIIFEMYDYGKNIDVIVPQNSITFDQVIEQFMGDIMREMKGHLDIT